MYRVSDGYNLDRKDKTYFDKYGVMELINASREMSSQLALNGAPSQSKFSTQSYEKLDRYKNNSNSAYDIIKKTTEQHYAEREGQDTDRISSIDSASNNLDAQLANV